MKTRGLRVLLLVMMTTVTWLLAGCGNGGGRLATNGTLSLADITVTDLSGGKYAVETTVTFTSASETEHTRRSGDRIHGNVWEHNQNRQGNTPGYNRYCCNRPLGSGAGF